MYSSDAEYINNEGKYKELNKKILNPDVSDSESKEENDKKESSDENSSTAMVERKEDIIVDNTETNATVFKRTICLIIHSSFDFEEYAHKLMKISVKPGQETEVYHIFLDCCAKMKIYETFSRLLINQFCAIKYVTPFKFNFFKIYII